jgi:hypothetical protein
MMTCAKHALIQACAAFNCSRGTTSAVFNLATAGLVLVVLSGCCGPGWFCEGHHRHW